MNVGSLDLRGGTVIAPGGPVATDLRIVDGRIAAIGEMAGAPELEIVDATGCWVVPGFVDAQINGGHGIDLTSEPHRIDELAELLTRDGVTSFVPTIVTSSDDTRRAALLWWARRRAGRTVGRPAARAVGLHFEGPMIAPVRRGAHAERLIREPAATPWQGWSRDAGVVMVTLAPELPGAIDVIAQLVDRAVVVAIGHTDATAPVVTAAIDAGATAVTHLFNAMRPFTHRDPGPIGVTLAHDTLVAGLIADGIHVDPVAVRMAWRALGPGRTMLVTDAVAAMGRPAQTSHLGTTAVTSGGDDTGEPTSHVPRRHAADGTGGGTDQSAASASPPVQGVRTADGTLAGSDLSLDQAVRNLVEWTGCTVPDAVATVTSTPARLLGLTDRGVLEPGALGDVTVLDRELRVIVTVVGGLVAWTSGTSRMP